MQLFDTFVMVDWSAANKPVTNENSIWWAVVRADGSSPMPRNPSTRRAAEECLATFLIDELKAERRVFAGFDFLLGYPERVARRLTGEASALKLWDWIARNIRDDPDNANNRFEVGEMINAHWPGVGPCWGRPNGKDFEHMERAPARTRVPMKKRDRTSGAPEYRETERRAKAKSVWQLYGAGSVGSQTLVGISMLKHLRERPKIAGMVQVWPFETGLQMPDLSRKPLVFVEIYTALYRRAVKKYRQSDEVLDRAQVRVAAAAVAELDRQERLGPLFEKPEDLTPDKCKAATREEGWIFGLGHEAELDEAAERAFNQHG